MRTTTRAGLYVRVSSGSQDTKAQESALRTYAQSRGWSVVHVYADKISGARDSRPALDALMAACRQRKLDIALVWKFDRWGRSLRHLIASMEELKRLGVAFVSATEGIDTTVPSGELVFAVIAALAQFERTLIGERVKAGIAEAKRNGKRLGRPPIRPLSAAEVQKIRAARRKGATLRRLASEFRTSLWAVHQACRS